MSSDALIPSPIANWRIGRWVIAAMLVVHAVLLGWGAARHSPTTDEIAYLPSGLSHWQLGRFELANVSPPLVRLVGSIPLLIEGPVTNWNYQVGPGLNECHAVGQRFVIANGAKSVWLFTIARWACIPFSLLGLWACSAWAKSLYGGRAGVLAGLLWCFCPNILAHGQLVTPDVGAAAMGIWAGYTFWRWTQEPTLRRALMAGAALGLAELTRTTFLLFFPLWSLLWAISTACRSLEGARRGRTAGQLALLFVVALFLVNDGYLFEGSGTRLGQYEFVSASLGGKRPIRVPSGNRFRGSFLEHIPVPLPQDYVLGIDLQKQRFEDPSFSRSYLHGEWRNGGWWYYYLYAFAVKVPIGTLVLFGLAALTRFSSWRVRPDWRTDVFLLLPPLAILALASSQTGFNRHFRYVLTAFPFFFVWASQLAAAIRRAGPWIRCIAGAACVATVTSSLWTYPHSLSYFNELVGGPRQGHAHLLSSNISWGQDLLYLKEWLDAHPEARPFHLAYAATFPPEALGLAFPLPPPGPSGRDVSRQDLLTDANLGPRPGWYAVSVDFLRGDTFPRDAKCEYFLRFKPVALAGYSLYIYHLQANDVARVRNELGLAPL